jgi:ribosomal protein S18 acetylase RimI-like enzyme
MKDYHRNGEPFSEYFQTPDLTVIIARDSNNDLEGFAIAGGGGFLFELHVRHKRRGTGRALLHALICTGWEATEISVEVHKKNEDAQRFYEAMGMGFNPLKETDGIMDGMVVMCGRI